MIKLSCVLFFFFNDTATTEIYTLSLHDALPISGGRAGCRSGAPGEGHRIDHRVHDEGRQEVAVRDRGTDRPGSPGDRKSTRLNSSHANISYAVFCLKKNIAKAGICAYICWVNKR